MLRDQLFCTVTSPFNYWVIYNRVVPSEAVDWCICFILEIQHGCDWERSRPQGPKNVYSFLMTMRPLIWACGHGTEMLLILKKIFSTWLFPYIFRYDSPKKCPTILYAVNLWLKPVPATGARLFIDMFVFRIWNFWRHSQRQMTIITSLMVILLLLSS